MDKRNVKMVQIPTMNTKVKMRCVALRILKSICLFILIILIQAVNAAAANREYDLVIEFKDVNFTGKAVKAMTINGNIPGPTLFMTEGDYVKIRVHNRMPVETSIHWHGILLPNIQDGVPYLTTPPIKAGKTHTFEFPVIQSGTYWYHSHTGLQEQRGVYGSIVIYAKKERIQTDREYVLVFSDWTDENPDEVLRTLKRGSDYYSLKKGAVQSLSGAVRAKALPEMFQREWIRMPPMDISDVAQDRFLANGKTETLLDANPGETVRLRIINAAASSYFYLQYAGGAMQVVSADGLDVQPVSLNRFLMAIAETYDVLVKVPHKGAFELRATAQDGSGYASAYIGGGKRVNAQDVPKPNLYKMHGGMTMADETHPDKNAMSGQKMNTAGHKAMQMETGKQGTPLPPYKKLRSIKPTTLPNGLPWHTITLNLTGDMERYVWSFNNKILTEADLITIRRGQNVRIIFENETMMHHPMHFHGHFFRILNGQGDHAPLKHTVDVPPLGKQIIEFYGSEDKDWFLHCHILYHMKAGMARVVHYEGSDIDAGVAAARKEPTNFLNQDHWYAWGEASFLSQMTDGSVVFSNTRNILSGAWEYGWEEEEYEIVLTYDYYFNRFFTAFGGMDIIDEDSRGILGIRYLLPLNVESALWVDSEGELRIILEKDLQLTDRLSAFGDVEYDTESEWEWVLGLEWTLNKQFSLVGKYHSEFGLGGGVSIRF